MNQKLDASAVTLYSTRGLGIPTAWALLVGAAIAAGASSWLGLVTWPGHDRTVVSAPRGQPVQFALPDGSGVMLGPGSTIRYSSAMTGEAERDVHLDGEAYFEVTPAAQRPLGVHAGDLTAAIDAKALVRAYPEDQRARIVVREGTAVVAGQVVGVGEVGWLATPEKPAIAAADTNAWFAWTQGRLAFTDAFQNAIPRLNRWYDLDLRVADSAIGAAVLVATLPDTMAEGTLEVIAFALSARLERQGHRVIFHAADSRPR